jgi:hypothetical protein
LVEDGEGLRVVAQVGVEAGQEQHRRHQFTVVPGGADGAFDAGVPDRVGVGITGSELSRKEIQLGRSFAAPREGVDEPNGGREKLLVVAEIGSRPDGEHGRHRPLH